MRAAAVLDRHHVGVGIGELVGAHAEACLQRTRQRDEETAGAAVGRRLLRHCAVRTELRGVPAVGGLQPAVPGQHLHPAQAEFEGHLLELLIAGVGVTRHQPGIVRRRRQQVAGAEVARLQPFAPRHPVRRQQGTVARQQHHLGHPRRPVRRPHQGHRPVPAAVAGQGGGKGMGGHIRGLGPYAEVRADLRLRTPCLGDAHVGTGQVHRSRPGLLHRPRESLVDGQPFGRCVHVVIVASTHCRSVRVCR
jgi:hypothetical protein